MEIIQNLESPPEEKYSTKDFKEKINQESIERENLFKEQYLIENYDNNEINKDEIDKTSPISFAKLIQENENLSKQLKKEVLKNEEQKNYIKILKETLESKLFKTGISEIIESSKEYQQFQEYNKDEGKTIGDFLIDFITFKEETTDRSKQDIINNEMNIQAKKIYDLELKNIDNNNLINKLTNDINLLKEKNREMNDINLEQKSQNTKLVNLFRKEKEEKNELNIKLINLQEQFNILSQNDKFKNERFNIISIRKKKKSNK